MLLRHNGNGHLWQKWHPTRRHGARGSRRTLARIRLPDNHLRHARTTEVPVVAKPISKFFAELGLPLRNIRWSWGARSDNIVLLRTWQDEYRGRERKVTVLREPAALDLSESFGVDERIVQLKALWSGEVAGYAVLAEVRDRAERPRHIKDYREDVVFPIKRLELQPNGAIAAELGDPVAVAKLREHSQGHRTAPGEGPFPVDDSQRSGLSTDSYQQKIPAIRAWLIEVCHQRGTVYYSDVMNRFGLTFYPLRNAMSRLGHDCKNAGEPIITAVIVDKETGRCSQGLYDEFHIDDDELERQRCYALWSAEPTALEALAAAAPEPQVAAVDEELEQRVARFTKVQVRTEQSAFREAVFRAFDGKCALSGCDVPEALEAAHRVGRDWRKGHNSATDGILLRRDLHALYDAGLLRIDASGFVAVAEGCSGHYGQLHGIKAALPAIHNEWEPPTMQLKVRPAQFDDE